MEEEDDDDADDKSAGAENGDGGQESESGSRSEGEENIKGQYLCHLDQLSNFPCTPVLKHTRENVRKITRKQLLDLALADALSTRDLESRKRSSKRRQFSVPQGRGKR